MWGETKEGVKRYCIQPEELLDLLKAIGSDNLGICWDTEHGAIENLDQDKAIAKVGPYLRATHISDQTDRGNVHVLPYTCLLYTSPSPRDYAASRMPSSA